MYAIQVLQLERDILAGKLEQTAEVLGKMDELDQAIISLQLLYDSNPGSKIITKDRLEEIREGVVEILVRETTEALDRIVEGIKKL